MDYLRKLVRIIKQSRRTVIATHIDPDCDGISAALGCAYLVRRYKRRKPTLFCYSPIPSKYRFLLRKWRFVRTLPPCDLLIAVDSAGMIRIFPDADSLTSAQLHSKVIVNIDHHKSNDAFGELQIVREKASSSCEIIYDLFKKLRIKFDRYLAEILYSGIYMDTGGFVYSNTTASSLKVAAELISLGVRPGQLVKNLNEKTLDGTLLLSRVLKTIKIKHGVGVMWLTQDMLKSGDANMADSENFVSFLQAIEDVKVSLFLREEHGATRISLRSDGIIDVDKFARRYGGGGHRAAAGIRLKKDIDTAKREMLSALLRELGKK